ncbi:hypothetical protein [Spiroplasma diminutum]|uniref:Lipoprotein n=1 Tax=Spiroplasma diminutum CUAS-1 TaxID=1276221 RepID=S5LZ50_9MOLU|nr:hypothetical protein [Spiroplasma diminutum]AGR41841.1 hypothetical protein SDIMI_v3c01370 [Spiroplasma diminutum CUAS-1]
MKKSIYLIFILLSMFLIMFVSSCTLFRKDLGWVLLSSNRVTLDIANEESLEATVRILNLEKVKSVTLEYEDDSRDYIEASVNGNEIKIKSLKKVGSAQINVIGQKSIGKGKIFADIIKTPPKGPYKYSLENDIFQNPLSPSPHIRYEMNSAILQEDGYNKLLGEMTYSSEREMCGEMEKNDCEKYIRIWAYSDSENKTLTIKINDISKKLLKGFYLFYINIKFENSLVEESITLLFDN